MGCEALTLTERKLENAEGIEHPPCIKGSRSVVEAQVKRNGGVGLRILLVDSHARKRVRPGKVGVQRHAVAGALLQPDNPRLIVGESQCSVPEHGVVALEVGREGRFPAKSGERASGRAIHSPI